MKRFLTWVICAAMLLSGLTFTSGSGAMTAAQAQGTQLTSSDSNSVYYSGYPWSSNMCTALRNLFSTGYSKWYDYGQRGIYIVDINGDATPEVVVSLCDTGTLPTRSTIYRLSGSSLVAMDGLEESGGIGTGSLIGVYANAANKFIMMDNYYKDSVNECYIVKSRYAVSNQAFHLSGLFEEYHDYQYNKNSYWYNDLSVTKATFDYNYSVTMASMYEVSVKMSHGTVPIISSQYSSVADQLVTAYVNSGYYKLSDSDGNVTPTATPTAAPTATPTAAPSANYTFKTTAKVNVRSGPGTSYSKVCTLAKGSTGKLISKGATFSYVLMSSGKYGYISNQYITISGGTAATPTATPKPTSAANPLPTEGWYWEDMPVSGDEVYAVRCNEYISLRSNASNNATVLAKVYLYDEMTYVQRVNQFFSKVKYNGVTGYVLSYYLDTLCPFGFYESSCYCVGNCSSYIGLYSSPSTSSTRIKKLYINGWDPIVKIANASNGFWRVRVNGVFGYVKSKYMVRYPEL